MLGRVALTIGGLMVKIIIHKRFQCKNCSTISKEQDLTRGNSLHTIVSNYPARFCPVCGSERVKEVK